jgi:hypothetical protein
MSFRSRAPNPDPELLLVEDAEFLEQLQLLEGQDMSLVRAEELLAGSIWSARHSHCRPLADGLLEVMQEVLRGQR